VLQTDGVILSSKVVLVCVVPFMQPNRAQLHTWGYKRSKIFLTVSRNFRATRSQSTILPNMSIAAVVTNLPPPGQPDIQYAPSFEKWQARASSRLKNENLTKTLPDGFPTELKGNLVWDGDSVAESYDWVYRLSADELREIDTAVAHFKSKWETTKETRKAIVKPILSNKK
jgi:hypothetical protein